MITRRDPEAFIRRLQKQDAMLVAAGRPPMPPWWLVDTLPRFERAGKRRRVVRKGRRVFASTCVAPRLATCEMLFGGHQHVPGTPPIEYAFLSVKRDEAANRLRGVKDILDIYGEKYVERGDTIELLSRPALFTVLTANHRLSVGGTIGFAWCDEVDSWNDDALGANPAEQVVGRLAPALATLPDAPLYLVSSPLSIDGYHSKQFDLGETPAQSVAFGATWTINPTLTEAVTHEIEPDEKLWRREYAAIPAATASPAFEPELVARCFRPLPEGCSFYPPIGTLDSAAGKSAKSDQMTWGVFSYAMAPPPPRYLIGQVPKTVHTVMNGVEVTLDSKDQFFTGLLRDKDGYPIPNPDALKPPMRLLVMNAIDSVGGTFAGELNSGRLWDRIAVFFRNNGVQSVYGDGYGAPYAINALGKVQIMYRVTDWTNKAKGAAVYRVRQLMSDGALILPHHPKLKAELLGFTERISPTGTVAYDARGTGKDDHVDLVLNAAMMELERKLPGSPLTGAAKGYAPGAY